MPELKEIIENKRNIRYFSDACRQGSLSHACIFCGADGSGKMTLAFNIAAALLCSETAGKDQLKACGKCESCIKVKAGSHPDLIFVNHQKEKLISVDEIREQVVNDITVKPYYGPYKIYILEDAQLMNANAQNALLKTLEEPPEYGLIFLLTSSPDTLLETIRSRSVRIDMDRFSDDLIRNMISAKPGISDEQAEDIVSFSKGNPGLAMELAENGDVSQMRNEVYILMSGLAHMDAFTINGQAKKIEKDDTGKMLDMLRMWMRDVLYVKSTGNSAGLYFLKYADTLKIQADTLSYESIDIILKSIDEADAQMNYNVKAEAAAEVMLLKMRRELYKS